MISEGQTRQLLIRNTPGGCVWQVYHIKSDLEYDLITRTASGNGFLSFTVETECDMEETFPGWRESKEWKDYLEAQKTPV